MRAQDKVSWESVIHSGPLGPFLLTVLNKYVTVRLQGVRL
jgi:hypothetical protein